MNKIELYQLRRASWRTMEPKLDVLLYESSYDNDTRSYTARVRAEISYVCDETGDINVEVFRTYQKKGGEEERGSGVTLTIDQIVALSSFVESFNDEVAEQV